MRLLGVGSPALEIRLPCRIPQTILARAPPCPLAFLVANSGVVLVLASDRGSRVRYTLLFANRASSSIPLYFWR